MKIDKIKAKWFLNRKLNLLIALAHVLVLAFLLIATLGIGLTFRFEMGGGVFYFKAYLQTLPGESHIVVLIGVILTGLAVIPYLYIHYTRIREEQKNRSQWFAAIFSLVGYILFLVGSIVVVSGSAGYQNWTLSTGSGFGWFFMGSILAVPMIIFDFWWLRRSTIRHWTVTR